MIAVYRLDDRGNDRDRQIENEGEKRRQKRRVEQPSSDDFRYRLRADQALAEIPSYGAGSPVEITRHERLIEPEALPQNGKSLRVGSPPESPGRAISGQHVGNHKHDH